MWTARKAPLSGTPERSNPTRDLVKRKTSPDGGRRIRKRDRQLTRASEGRRMCKHQSNRPGLGNRLRTGKGSRMRRLAGGERSTRFEPASQHSQLPLLRTGGHPSKSTFQACVCQALTEADLETLSETPSSLRLGPCHFSGSNPFVKLLACQNP